MRDSGSDLDSDFGRLIKMYALIFLIAFPFGLLFLSHYFKRIGDPEACNQCLRLSGMTFSGSFLAAGSLFFFGQIVPGLTLFWFFAGFFGLVRFMILVFERYP